MIIYRPIAPLTTGRTGLKAALAAMALTAVLGTSWQVPVESPLAPEATAETAQNELPTGVALSAKEASTL